MVCQFAAVMEIVHPLVGFVKTSPVTPLLQVLFVEILHVHYNSSDPYEELRSRAFLSRCLQ